MTVSLNPTRRAAVALLVLLALLPWRTGQAGTCQPPAAPMLAVRLFLGQSLPGGGQVSPRDWRRFLAETVTPRFPDGFTVLAAEGQWRDPRSGRIIREPSRVLLVAAEDDAATRAKVAEIAGAWRDRFHQQSVGILAEPACGAF